MQRKPHWEHCESCGMATHNFGKLHKQVGDCTDPGPEARALGCLRRFSFLRTLFLHSRCYSRVTRIILPRQALRALSARAPAGPKKKVRGHSKHRRALATEVEHIHRKGHTAHRNDGRPHRWPLPEACRGPTRFPRGQAMGPATSPMNGRKPHTG